MMKKALLVLVSLLVLVVAAVIYHFNVTKNDLDVVQSNTLDVSQDEGSGYQSKVMRELFSVNTGRDWMVSVPDIDTSAALTDIVDRDGVKYASGGYDDGYEKGMVLLDYMKIRPVQIGNPEKDMWFLAPFVVAGQGSGYFWYLGLFRFDHNSHIVAHRGSYFVGDRVKITGLDIDEPFDVTGSVILTFLDYAEGQGFGKPPEEKRIQKLGVSEQGLIEK
ncbi:hypothetical protein [Endozoicomonas sp. Mp262]|uniref:hypothetical protein n=1 Tax=Endozoicomonas sp. Mp262 TaxID=2919499 RepID=UPI0021DA6D24